MSYEVYEPGVTLLARNNTEGTLGSRTPHRGKLSPGHDKDGALKRHVSDGWTGKHDPESFDTGDETGNGAEAIEALSTLLQEYWLQEKLHYEPSGRPLTPDAQGLFGNFYSPFLLRNTRIVELKDSRIATPPFFARARAMGLSNLPDISHQASMTFLNVIVFQEKISNRLLFHGLVHVAQAHVLGVERYAELFIRGFLRTRSYFMVPLKSHAFAMDLRFAQHPSDYFSVEAEIRRWVKEGRY